VQLRVLPGCVCGTLRQGWFHRKELASASHAAAETNTKAGDAPASQPGLSNDGLAQSIDAVLLELGKAASLQGARFDVVLADSLVHLDVVEGDFVGDSDRQLQSVAIACVDELLGDSSQDHEIRWQLQADGKHLLIGATPRAHLRALADAAARHGLSLGSVQPDFCLQWNCHAETLKPGSAVFAVACGYEAVVAQVSEGAVAALSTGAWLDRPDQPGAATAHVKRLMCNLGLEPSVTAGVLDARVDRLLASLGLDSKKQSAYVLVAPELPDKAVSARWTVLKERHPS
jgi:hypothetical protein